MTRQSSIFFDGCAGLRRAEATPFFERLWGERKRRRSSNGYRRAEATPFFERRCPRIMIPSKSETLQDEALPKTPRSTPKRAASPAARFAFARVDNLIVFID